MGARVRSDQTGDPPARRRRPRGRPRRTDQTALIDVIRAATPTRLDEHAKPWPSVE